MSNLLKEAIADAKAVRETAMQNAKAVLEEAFTPKLQSMLAAKLQQETAVDPELEGPDKDQGLEINEFENIEEDGTGAAGYMGRHGDVMNETEVPASEHTNDPQGASNELSSGPSDQDTDSTPNTDTSSEGPKAGGNLTPSNTDKSDVGAGKQIAASDQDTNQTPDNDTSNELHLHENELDEDHELSAIIAELEGELGDVEDPDEVDMEPETGDMEPETGDMEPEMAPEADELDVDGLGGEEIDGEESAVPAVDSVAGEEEEDDEPIDLEEILREMELSEVADCDDKAYDMEDKKIQEIESLKKENAEYKKALGVVQQQLNEVNMLNAKLLYTNKVFKAYGLNNDQKMTVVESFDRASSVREVKLTYATICESFKLAHGTKKKSSITEGIASKVVTGTKPSAKTQQKQKQILSEGNDLATRFQKLAGIKKIRQDSN